MTISLIEQVSSSLRDNTRLPESSIAYFEQRTLDEFYDFVIQRFEESRKKNDLTKAKLAKRIGRSPEQVNRLLANPGNWTIATLARLLLGISGEEADLDAKSIFGRPRANLRVSDLLDKPTTISHLSLEDTEVSSTTHISITTNWQTLP